MIRAKINQVKAKYGSFVGNGTSQTISSLGFTPVLVIITSSSATANVRKSWRSAAMTGDTTASFVGAIANFTGGITSLGEDSFTVGSSVVANENGVTMYYMAFPASPSLNYGSYTGNGLDNRGISGLTFTPNLVVVKSSSTGRGRWRTSDVSGDASLAFENVALSSTSNQIQSLDVQGFTVGTDSTVNTNAVDYYWFAFQNTQNFFKVGKYVGNGADSRNLPLTGFLPHLIWIKGDATENAAYRMPSQTGDLSFDTWGGQATANNIQLPLVDGFQVGTDATVNSNATTYYFAAWNTSIIPSRTIA